MSDWAATAEIVSQEFSLPVDRTDPVAKRPSSAVPMALVSSVSSWRCSLQSRAKRRRPRQRATRVSYDFWYGLAIAG